MDLQLEYRPGSATPPPSGWYTKYRAIFVVCKPGSNSELLSIQDSKTCTPSRLKTWLLIGGVSIKDKRASHAIPCSGINITEHTPYFVTRKENKAKKNFFLSDYTVSLCSTSNCFSLFASSTTSVASPSGSDLAMDTMCQVVGASRKTWLMDSRLRFMVSG